MRALPRRRLASHVIIFVPASSPFFSLLPFLDARNFLSCKLSWAFLLALLGGRPLTNPCFFLFFDRSYDTILEAASYPFRAPTPWEFLVRGGMTLSPGEGMSFVFDSCIVDAPRTCPNTACAPLFCLLPATS